MSFLEVVHRFQEQIVSRLPFPERRLRDLLPKSALEGSNDLSSICSRLSTESSESWCRAFTDEVLAGRTPIFGVNWNPSQENWSRDPLTGLEWPQVPAFRLNYRHQEGRDPKWIWEANRLVYLLPALQARRTGYRSSEVEAFVRANISAWIAQSKPGTGIAWAASIEVAIRAIVLTLASRSLGLSTETPIAAEYSKCLSAHVAWLLRYPSRFSSANNHRVAELSALLILDSHWSGALTPGERSSAEIELTAVLDSLFAADGVGLEQSPTYSSFSLELAGLALQCHTWGLANRRIQLQRTLARAVEALMQFTDERGRLLRYGDDDEGRLLTVCTDPEHVVQVLAVLAETRLKDRKDGLLTFPIGGYTILRRQEVTCETLWVMDHGPLGFGDIAAHGHADVLSVQLRAGGVDWIVDAGTFKYHGDKYWRQYFRSSIAHNSPMLENLDSSVMTGDFNWDRRNRAAGVLISSFGGESQCLIQAAHDGYVRRGFGRVSRTFAHVAKHSYLIIDKCDASATMSTRLMLHPDCSVSASGNGVWIASQPGSNIRVQIGVKHARTVTLVKPEDNVAWYSPRFGEKRPTWCVVGEALSREQPRLEFAITIQPKA